MTSGEALIMAFYSRAAVRQLFAAFALLSTLLLAGCQDTGTALLPDSARAPGIPVAFESLEGAPEAMRAQFAAVLGSEARARRLDIVGAGAPARYRIRGYLSAGSAEGGTALTYVWDVFDENARRAQRLTGAATSRTETKAGMDPWAAIDAASLRQAAAGGLNDIVAFLAASPGLSAGNSAIADARNAVQPTSGPALDVERSVTGVAPLGYAPF
jgi:hypothetical protein